ncbi:MAG TPA: type IV pilus assembly protein PilM [Actinomycetota bacterium]|nr:type IV pilus assembly protein PilM [Actinomycetota bacterium]
MARAKDSVGLDIGTSGVRAAHLSFGRVPYSLQNFGQVALPPGAVREGEIADSATVAQALSELWKRGAIKKKTVSLGISNGRVVARPIQFPAMTEDELRNALQFQAQEYIPFPVEDAVVDFQIVDEFVGDNNERVMQIYLVAGHKEMISTFVETIERAGLRLDSIDFIPMGLIRSLGETADSMERRAGVGEAIIDIGAGVTNVVVHEGGIPRFARVLATGGHALTDALSAGMGIPFEEAEAIKQRLGLRPPGPAAEVPGAQGDDLAIQILENRAGAFVDEVRGSIDYFLAQPESIQISRLVLSGGGSKLVNLGARLSAGLRGLPVEQGRALQRITVQKFGLTDEQIGEAEPLMGASVGVALGAAWQ